MKTFQLPSHRVVALEAAAPIRKAPRRRSAPVFSDLLDLCDAGTLVVADAHGAALDVRKLALRDFHALRAIATRLGWLHEETIEIECMNCDAPMRVSPCAALPLGPFADRELHDPELDATLDFTKAHEVPAIHVAGVTAREVVLRDVTVEEAAPLHRALRRRRLVLGPPIVRAMGIVRLGEVEDAAQIAMALEGCSDDAWDCVAGLFLQAHYPLRLFAAFRCDHCGARNDVDAPYDREFDVSLGAEPNQSSKSNEKSFPSFDEFDARAQAIWREILGDEAGGLVLVVEGGVPACDDGGEPLLGAYVPAHAGDATSPTRPPEVTVYYRTFRAVWDDDGAYDWSRELRDTLEHELEHHQGALLGHDPMDEEERLEIAREAEKIHGKKALAKASVRGLGGDLAAFLKVTWPVWVIVFVATAFFTICNR